MKATYDLVLIAGPDMDIDDLKKSYKDSGLNYTIIGDGKNPITRAELEALRGKIGSDTRIDINAHGCVSNGVHAVSLMDKNKNTLTSEVLSLIGASIPPQAAAHKKNLQQLTQVHLWSCYGGSAAKDIESLPAGTVLMTHASSEQITWVSMNEQGITEGIERHKGKISPFLEFAHAITLSPETATLTTKHNHQTLHYTARSSARPLTKALPRDLKERLLSGYISAMTPLKAVSGYGELMSNLKGFSVDDEEALKEYQKNACVIKEHLMRPGYVNLYLHTANPRTDLLNYAVPHTDATIVRTILADSHSEPNARYGAAGTLLHRAVKADKKEILIALLEDKRTNPELQDPKGNTALHHAAQDPDLTHLLPYFSRYKQYDQLHNIKNKEGLTALHLLARHGDADDIERVYTSRFTPPFVTDDDGAHPLHHAAAYGDPDNINAFLTARWPTNVNIKDKNGARPLHYAASDGDADNITALMARIDCNVNAQDSKDDTPLHYAASAGRGEHVETLLESHHTKPNMLNLLGYTALHKAIITGNEEAALVLIYEPRVNPDVASLHEGSTAMHYAVEKQNPVLIAALLKRKADLTCTNEEGHTPLELAQKMKSAFTATASPAAEKTASAIIALLTPLALDAAHHAFVGSTKQQLPNRSSLSVNFTSREARNDFERANRSLFSALSDATSQQVTAQSLHAIHDKKHSLSITWSDSISPPLADKMRAIMLHARACPIPPPPLMPSSPRRFAERVRSNSASSSQPMEIS